MRSARECANCTNRKTCGYECWHYWHEASLSLSPPERRKKKSQRRRRRTPPPSRNAKATAKSSNDRRRGVDNKSCRDEPDPKCHQWSKSTSVEQAYQNVIEDHEFDFYSPADSSGVESREETFLKVKDYIDFISNIDGIYTGSNQGDTFELDTNNLSSYLLLSSSPEVAPAQSPFITPVVQPAKPLFKGQETSNETNTSPKEVRGDSLTCTERKRLLVLHRPASVTSAMQTWVSSTLDRLDPFRSDMDCWMHPVPQRRAGVISRSFSWTDEKGPHALYLNFGIVHKLLHRTMTRRQQDGFITKGWHLSHCCGNWTCLNPEHTTVEPGVVNISRNFCFSHRSGCNHDPPCLKDKKVALLRNGMTLDSVSAGAAANSTWQASEDDYQPEYFDYLSMNTDSSDDNGP